MSVPAELPTPGTEKPQDLPSVIPRKSETDDREYRVITLSNGLKVLLVSDPETDKAAAAMDVYVGNWSDPENLPGLAHFLEHMLFLGTKKYPDENSYRAFLTSHAGYSNAYTDKEHTNYHFDVSHEFLEETLDRFASFFTEPLFTASATEREMLAVHSEHVKNEQDDSWRLTQLLRCTSNPKHPFSKFSTGNLQTLKEAPIAQGIDVRAELLKFYEQHYSSNLMSACILGRETLDVLQQWAVDKFSAVPNRDRQQEKFGEDAMTPETLQKLYRIVSIKEWRSLMLLWPMPCSLKLYRKSPCGILIDCLQYEGAGSILSLLKRKKWVNSLSAGTGYSTNSFNVFSVSLDLTPEGLSNVKEIIRTIYQYIQLLHQADSARWKQLYSELHDVFNMNFRFKSKEEPLDYCSSAASALQCYPAEDVLSAGWLYEDFDEPLSRHYLSFLRPDNMRVHIISPSFKGQTSLKEKWYGTEYDVEPISPQDLESFQNPGSNPDIWLQAPNDMIPTDFSLRAKPDDKETDSNKNPVKIVDTPELVVWHKLDRKFLKPKAYYYLYVASPYTYMSPTDSVLTTLYVDLMEDSLEEFACDASNAGLYYSLSWGNGGLSLVVSGYNHTLPLLLNKIIDRMRHLEIKQDRFDALKESFERSFRSFNFNSPSQHCWYYRDRALRSSAWSVEEEAAALQCVTVADVVHHSKLLFRQCHFEMLIYGNILADEALTLSRVVEKFGSKVFPRSEHTSGRIVWLPAGYTYRIAESGRNPDDNNSAAEVSLQAAIDTPELGAISDLFAHIASEPCFNQLRTQEQLGYSVYRGMDYDRGVLSYSITVQSADKTADYLDARVEAFLEQFGATLSSMPADEFQTNVDAVIANKLEKDKRMSEEADRLWWDIRNGRLGFDTIEKEVAVLRSVTKQEVLDFYNKYISISSPARRKMSFQVFGKGQTVPSAPPDALVDRLPVTALISSQLSSPVAAPAPIYCLSDSQIKQGSCGWPRIVAASPTLSVSATDDTSDEAKTVASSLSPVESPAADASPVDSSSSKSAQIVLPPAPVDPRRVLIIKDAAEFRRAMPFYPALV